MRAFTIALCLLATPALADVTGPASVIGGDTFEVQGEQIRLHGIDAPEARQTCWDDRCEFPRGQRVNFFLEVAVKG
jgi:endonuclease YncB( thermonuclease family)